MVGGWLSLLAAMLHLAVITGGPDWYRFVGAGEEMAVAAERGSWMPALVTLAIAAILAVWGLFAFSGAGRTRRLPLLRTALVAIAAIYLVRGLLLFPVLLSRSEAIRSPEPWASIVVLIYGTTYAIGTALGWRAMNEASAKPVAARS